MRSVVDLTSVLFPAFRLTILAACAVGLLALWNGADGSMEAHRRQAGFVTAHGRLGVSMVSLKCEGSPRGVEGEDYLRGSNAPTRGHADLVCLYAPVAFKRFFLPHAYESAASRVELAETIHMSTDFIKLTTRQFFVAGLSALATLLCAALVILKLGRSPMA